MTVRWWRRRPWLAAGVLATALVLVLLLGVLTAGLRVLRVTSGSMEPTVAIGQYLVVAPAPSLPERGDLVVFEPPRDWAAAYQRWVGSSTRDADLPRRLLKRVVGLPGDTVECCGADGALSINGERITEPYLAPVPERATIGSYRVRVPAGSLWLLGDHRTASFDSRTVHALRGDGTVPLTALSGRVARVVG